MNKKELYKELFALVPISHDLGNNYLKVLDLQFDKFIKLLEQTEDSEFTDTSKEQIIVAVNDMYKYIVDAVKLTYKGNHTDAFNSIDRALYKTEICLREFKCAKDYDFYRMRTLEDGKLFHRKDMFHIPFSKRGLVSTQRFSMPGLPCLYLGFSLHACWEEMHRKPISSFALNRFHLQKNLKVLSLDIPESSRWDSDFEKIIEIFPMIMACMVEVDNYNNSFKSEYIIPQLLMEWISTHPNVVVDGICYTSVHMNKQFNFPQSTYTNIALPATDFETGDLSEHLKELFTLTEPTTEEVERVKSGALVPILTIVDDEQEQLKENYKASLFGMLEDILKKDYSLGSI